MSNPLAYSTHFKNKQATIAATNVIVLLFQEDNAHIAYSPALDLSGYGYSDEEAKSSFEIVLKNFLDVTTKKGTLFSELKRLGWKVKNEKLKIFKAPVFDDLLVSNSSLAKLIEEQVSMRPMLQPVHFA